ncbi:MAG: YggS family pyridoxal phosphate-dependent enzyme [Bacteroidetes bacterium]|nr:YggS family pyridoxal phosphate-dependent enzyme [Bacteroidota bacterium]
MINAEVYQSLLEELKPFNATLLAVSKTKPVEDILALKSLGQKVFGENYVQELVAKSQEVEEVDWHFIGHLQSNKAKMIVPFVSLIHGVDSIKLLKEINKQAETINRIQPCLIQIFIAREETKFGLSIDEATDFLTGNELAGLSNIRIDGFMGMATNTTDTKQIRREFQSLRSLFELYQSTHNLSVLSMGMSSDYKIALEEGSTMIRIGSAIFGERVYSEKI